MRADKSYFQFDYDNALKYKYSHNHQKRNGQLIADSAIYFAKDNGENRLNLGHTLDKIYLTSI